MADEKAGGATPMPGLGPGSASSDFRVHSVGTSMGDATVTIDGDRSKWPW